MKRIKTDLCVIGAGSGGLSVAAGAVQMGARVVLIEGDKMGGDCLNSGCVPSKALIASARRAAAMRATGGLGVAAVEPEIDYAAAKERVARVIDTIAPIDSQERFEALGCTVIRERARFVSPSEVQAGETVVEARRFVLATGSRPVVPPIEGLDGVDYLTNETIFDLRERPEHLIVIGGGNIGVEMAQAHRRLGSKVTVIEGSEVLGRDDPEMASVVIERLRAEGIEIVEGEQVETVARTGTGVSVSTASGQYAGSHILVAVGRQVAVDGLDLDAGNVAHDRAITVGDDLRSVTNKRVYAVGDAAGQGQFTHLAGYHGGVVIRSILFGLRARARRTHIPWCTYTDPELAHVGLTPEQVRDEHGGNVEVVRVRYAENDRAQTEGQTAGLVKVSVVRGRPVGVTIVGAEAGELIAMWAMAIANNMKMKAVADTILPYPTLSEINKRAAGAYFSPRLFDSPAIKTVVGLVQKYLP